MLDGILASIIGYESRLVTNLNDSEAIPKTSIPGASIMRREEFTVLRDLLRDLVGNTIDRAGKGKDEFVRILGREMGLAAAAVLKEPLEQVVKSKKLKVTIEFVDAKEESKAKQTRTVKSHKPKS